MFLAGQILGCEGRKSSPQVCKLRSGLFSRSTSLAAGLSPTSVSHVAALGFLLSGKDGYAWVSYEGKNMSDDGNGDAN